VERILRDPHYILAPADGTAANGQPARP
jgi:hypothetical protein